MLKKNWLSIVVVCMFIFVGVFIFTNVKSIPTNSLVNYESVDEYFSEVNIPDLKFSNDKLTYKDNQVKAFFDPVEVAEKDGRYVGFVYSNGSVTDGIILIVRRDGENKIIRVEEISQEQLNKEVLGN